MCEKVYRGAHTISLSLLSVTFAAALPAYRKSGKSHRPPRCVSHQDPQPGPFHNNRGPLSLSLSFNNRSFATAFFSILPCRLRCPLGARHPPTAQLWFLIRFISPPSSQTRKRAVLYSTGFAFERIGTSRQILSDPAQPLATIAPHRNKI